MGVEEKPPRSSLTKVKEAHSEGFEWVPAGLTSGQVCQMSHILHRYHRTIHSSSVVVLNYNGFHSNFLQLSVAILMPL